MNMKVVSVVIGAFALVGAVRAADRFVSDDGTWVMPGKEGTGYATLQDAIKAARDGDTVWVKNGYVCDSGTMVAWSSQTNRIWIENKRITVRSEYGYVDEAAGKVATIRGMWDGKTDNPDFRCTPVFVSGTDAAVLQGFVIENGYGQQNVSWAGGGVRNSSGATVSNCVVRNCKCARGGGICGGKVYNTVVTNCTVKSDGDGSCIYGATRVISCYLADGKVKPALQWGGTTDELFVSNTTVTCSAGGVYAGGTIPNLQIVDSYVSNNVAAADGAGLRGDTNARIKVLRTKIFDNWCEGSGNYRGGGAYCCDLTKCDLVGNICKNGSGGAAYGCALTDCQVISNQTTRVSSSGAGAGACGCTLTNCVVAFNANTNTAWAGSCFGGGIDSSTAVNCRIYGNVSPYAGGGASSSTLYNCIVTNNVESGDGAGGGGAYNCVCYNVLFAKNWSYRGAGGLHVSSYPTACAVNCTFAENVIKGGLGGFRNVPLVENSISWGNTGTYDPDSCEVCRNSCIQKLSATTESSGVINTDPMFKTVDGLAYVPGARACRNVVTPADWMTDPNDARSKDVYGNPRVSGEKADFGAVEALLKGLCIFVR